mmetsp:Transcript_101209/g.179755  ORF Transcript_101209/g.179755 Transcript_101209/m.179755 type:complete len:99 (-) Transcript_101209:442-738(-)
MRSRRLCHESQANLEAWHCLRLAREDCVQRVPILIQHGLCDRREDDSSVMVEDNFCTGSKDELPMASEDACWSTKDEFSACARCEIFSRRAWHSKRRE